MQAIVPALAVGLCLAALPAAAFEPRSGCIVAERSCEAPTSVRRSDNPGGIHLEIGQVYRLLGANRTDATHLQIVVSGASPEQRWIPIDCGRVTGICEPVADQKTTPAEASHRENVLAVSWQPAFCEMHRRKPECRGPSPHSFDATNLTLHGLWPQPRSLEYCDMNPEVVQIDEDGRWDLLPRVDLDTGVRDELVRAMPGTWSMLDRHEWTRHGRCYGSSADEYFRDSLALLAELNASSVRTLVASRIGRRLSLAQLRSTVDSAFGAGAGDRVAMDCDRVGNRTLVTGLRLNLTGNITPESGLAELLARARPAGESCSEGIIDPAGPGPG
jgi:ribonuclease T2